MFVSVVIPAYNSIYVRDAIVSILSQTHQDLEVIVVDDGSPGTAIETICAEFPKVRFLRQKNSGPSVARNYGIREAKGDWIAFLDDDDIWLPEKLAKQVEFIESHPMKDRIGLLYTGQYMFHDEGVLGSKVDDASGMIYQYLLFGNFIGTCSSIMIPKHVFACVGDYDEKLICSQDFDLYLKIAREFEIHSIPEPLIKYRTRPDQISKDPTLNNADDEEILRRQEPHVSPDFFKKVRAFHRKISSLRYKQTAYDALFRQKDRGAYWKWLSKSVGESREMPSVPSLFYLFLTLAPAVVIDRVAHRKRRDGKGTGGDITSYQKVAENFTWMGVRRGDLGNSNRPVTDRTHS